MGEAAAHRRRRTTGAAIWALVLLAALVAGSRLLRVGPELPADLDSLAERAAGLSRRRQVPAGSRHVRKHSGPRLQLDFQGAWPDDPVTHEFPDQTGAVPPGSIATARTLSLNRHPVTFVGEDGFTEQDSHNGTFTVRWNVTTPLAAGEAFSCASTTASTRGAAGTRRAGRRGLLPALPFRPRPGWSARAA